MEQVNEKKKCTLFDRTQYFHRFRTLKEESGLSTKDIEKRIREILEKDGEEMPSDTVIEKWANGYRVFPSIGGLAILANIFKVSVGYLLGQHDDRNYFTGNTKISVNLNKLSAEYMDIYNESITYDSCVNGSWFLRARKKTITGSARPLPFFKVIEETGFSADYCFGLSKHKYWPERIDNIGLPSLRRVPKEDFDDSLEYGMIVEFVNRTENPKAFYGILADDLDAVILKDRTVRKISDFSEYDINYITTVRTHDDGEDTKVNFLA